MDTTLACFRGYADCVDGAVEKGIIYGAWKWTSRSSLYGTIVSVIRYYSERVISRGIYSHIGADAFD